MAAERWTPFLASKPLPASTSSPGEPTIGSRGFNLLDYVKQRAQQKRHVAERRSVGMIGKDKMQADGAFDDDDADLYTVQQRRVKTATI